MKLVSWSTDSVRMDCRVCGAHTQLELPEYLTCAYGRYPVWCSTCGVLREVEDEGRFGPAGEREQEPGAQLSVAE
jgi:hypothetical protein